LKFRPEDCRLLGAFGKKEVKDCRLEPGVSR
jgi:hypothetical protein